MPKKTVLPLLIAPLCLLFVLALAGYRCENCRAADKPERKVHPSLIPITDEPGLPRVLLIGDSISMGYTVPVRELLAGKANVHRIPGNGGSTNRGIDKMDAWLGDEKWDVIHFNFGIHDSKLPPEGTGHSPPDVYEANLRKIVHRLKASGAKLIWATSTPIPNGGVLAPDRRFGDINDYNAIAQKVMKENGIAIDDLNTAVTPYTDKYLKPGDLHYTDEGSAFLATQVAASIEEALK